MSTGNGTGKACFEDERGLYSGHRPRCFNTCTLELIYLFKADELRGLAASLFSSISQDERARIPTLKRTDLFPYRSQSELRFHESIP